MRPHLRKRRPQRLQGGFSLIEALVAILIFSIGVLALVGLQVASVQQSTSAKYRSEAALLANRLVGRMWVSNRVPTSLQADFATGGAGYTAWASEVQAQLPNADGTNAPSVSVSGDGVVTIDLRWKVPSEAASAPSNRYTVVTQIKQ